MSQGGPFTGCNASGNFICTIRKYNSARALVALEARLGLLPHASTCTNCHEGVHIVRKVEFSRLLECRLMRVGVTRAGPQQGPE